MSDGTVPYTLKRPVPKGIVKAGGEVPSADMVTEIKVRRPTAGDLRVTDAHKGEMAKAVALLSTLSGLPPRTIDRIDVEDFEALSNIIGDFSAAGRAA